MNPQVDRPEMPDGYGLERATAYVEWSAVEERLRESLHYWLSTTRPDGRPHSVPRWGVWLDGRFWYDGSPETVHSRNLQGNRFCVLTLEDGAKAVIVEGVSVPCEPIVGELGEKLSQEVGRKYGPAYTPGADAWSGNDAGGMRTLLPAKAMAWTTFPGDPTRFTF